MTQRQDHALRLIAERDFNQCVHIAKEAWPEFKERNSIYHLFSKHFKETCFVAEVNGNIVGFVLGFISQTHREIGYIHLVATKPSHQRNGIATLLYNGAFLRFNHFGCSVVKCTVNPDNLGSLSFHKRLGFRPEFSGKKIRVGRVWATKDYNGVGHHMVELCRPISS